MQTGQEELFSLDDVAAALGCTKEEAAAEMERHGIQGMTISTLPGFEWALARTAENHRKPLTLRGTPNFQGVPPQKR